MSRHAHKPKLESAWTLWRAAWKSFRADWKPYINILAVVTLPIDILGLFGSIATDASINAYAAVASLIMNVALIWAVVHADKYGAVPSTSSSYYDGSSAIVRFLLVTIALVLMLIPAAFGAAIYLASLAAVDVTGGVSEQLLIGSVCLLISVPSIWLLVRFGLAPLAAVDKGLAPLAALRYARNLTLGRFWRTLARFAMLALYLVAVAVPIAIVTAILVFLKLGGFPTFFFQIATTFTALPLANLYLLRLLRSLEKPAVVIDKAI